MKVEVVTLEKVSGSENKFYRAFYGTSGSSFGLKQWGSQRSGRNGGQFQPCDNYDALDVVAKKKSEGYREVDRASIVLDDARVKALQGNKKVLGGYCEAELAGQKNSNAPSPSNQPKPKPANTGPAPKPDDDPLNVVSFGLDDITAKCMATLEIAATDPIKASTHVAVIRDEVDKAERELAKIHSYLTTIDILTSEGLT